MKSTRAAAAAALAFGCMLAGARALSAQEAPSAEDRLAAALETVMTDEIVDGVAACASAEYSGWTARSQPGGMFFECRRAPGAKTGEPKAYLPASAVEKALEAQGLAYYADYGIVDSAARTRVDRATIDRAAARAIRHRKAERAMNGAAALPKS